LYIRIFIHIILFIFFKFYINDNKYLEEENLIKENILKIKLNELKEKNKILKSNFEELDKLLKQLET
jgi:hypothetical protein